jgi:hypothetical protein
MQAVLLYTLPLIFMSVAYYHIVKTLWRRNNLHGGQENHESSSQMHNGNGTSSMMAR